MNWITGIQNALYYIEDNITEELDYSEISKQAYVSSFHFQRVFSILCGFTLGEYIRNRRLTLAGTELSAGDSKVIDIALKYGYDSPDSFTKAFSRFHGLSPSSAKNKGASLKSFAPLKINFTLKGGNTMEYKIIEKEAFTVMGVLKEINYETSYAEIPEFWSEHFAGDGGKHVCGMYGICFDDNDEGKTCCEDNNDGKTFSYIIADDYDSNREIPDGYVTKTFPAGTWAIFPCKGALPKALQDVNTRIWNEWIPNCREYELAGNFNVEMYTAADNSSEDYYSEIWVPVKKV